MALYDNYNIRFNTALNTLEMNTGAETWVPVPGAGGTEITSLTGAVIATGPGAAVATLTSTSVTAAVLTGYVSGAGTLGATDTILQGFNKLNGNIAALGSGPFLSLTGGTLSGALLVSAASQPTTTAREVISQASGKLGLAFTGLAIDASTSTDGLGFYLLHNAANNRQLGLVDTLIGPVGAANIIRFGFTPGAAIDAFTGDLSAPQPLSLGNATALTTMPGVVTFLKAPVYAVGSIAGTGTVTPVATAGPTFTSTVSNTLTINGPSAGYDGQKITFRIINDASHSVTLATGSGNFRFGTDITAYTNSVSKTDYVGAIYNLADLRWDVVSVVQGF